MNEEKKLIQHWTPSMMTSEEKKNNFYYQCSLSPNYGKPDNRNLDDYKKRFVSDGASLSNHLDRLFSSSAAPPISVLDSGAGQGNVLIDLLGNENTKCTGITRHPYSEHATQLIEQKYCDRLEWFFGEADEILPTLPSAGENGYDLILDHWGSYFYSHQGKASMLFQYWRLLKPGGRAFVIVDNDLSVFLLTDSSDGKTQKTEFFLRHLCHRFPRIFQLVERTKNLEDSTSVKFWLIISKDGDVINDNDIPDLGKEYQVINFTISQLPGKSKTTNETIMTDYPSSVLMGTIGFHNPP